MRIPWLSIACMVALVGCEPATPPDTFTFDDSSGNSTFNFNIDSGGDYAIQLIENQNGYYVCSLSAAFAGGSDTFTMSAISSGNAGFPGGPEYDTTPAESDETHHLSAGAWTISTMSNCGEVINISPANP